jgi:hypothetical protein
VFSSDSAFAHALARQEFTLTYQISRNGQIYGPYTLDDLKRYLASGNVLLTDLAKSEAMPDWLPVARILAQDGGSVHVPPSVSPQPEPYTVAGTAPAADYAAPHTPPYAPAGFPSPPANAALAASPYPDPPSLHWGLVALFSVFTCGLFMLVWNLIVCAWLKRVQPNATALLYYIAAAVCVLLMCLTPGASAHVAFRPGLHSGNNSFGSLLFLVFWVLKLVARFMEQASLEEHFNGPEPIGLRLNPVMTFFFGGLYFQHHLTRIAALKQAARYATTAPYPY